MNNSTDHNLSAELLNDFYAECEEHLNVARQCLLSLEEGNRREDDAPIVEKLFRSFHSLKGIIAIVGISAAEHLAHQTEDYLRDLAKGHLPLTDERFPPNSLNLL